MESLQNHNNDIKPSVVVLVESISQLFQNFAITPPSLAPHLWSAIVYMLHFSAPERPLSCCLTPCRPRLCTHEVSLLIVIVFIYRILPVFAINVMLTCLP